jgi:hypothetical protein
MAREMINTIRATVISVVDETYGGYERGGKEVEVVERYGVYVLQEFGQEPIGPLMATSGDDLVAARALRGGEAVYVRVSTVPGVDRWGKGYLQHRAPRGEGSVFIGVTDVDVATGEIAELREVTK